MPIKGSEILKLVILKLKEAGLKENDQLEVNVIEKAIKALGYYDARTIKKYSEAVLESPFVKVEETFKEVKRIQRLKMEEILQRSRSENWSNQKLDVYKKVFLYGSFAVKQEDEDWALVDEADIIIEKVSVGKKVFIDHFP